MSLLTIRKEKYNLKFGEATPCFQQRHHIRPRPFNRKLKQGTFMKDEFILYFNTQSIQIDLDKQNLTIKL